MKALVLAATMLAAFTLAAYAEANPAQVAIDKQRREQAVQVDKEYQKALKRGLGNDAPAAKPDPWGNVRGTDQPKQK